MSKAVSPYHMGDLRAWDCGPQIRILLYVQWLAGVNQFYIILISESLCHGALYGIWKLCCEWEFTRDGDPSCLHARAMTGWIA